MKDVKIGIKLDLIAKLLFMQTIQNISTLESNLVKTDKQKKLYQALDGKKAWNSFINQQEFQSKPWSLYFQNGKKEA